MDLSAPALLKKLQGFRKTIWFRMAILLVLGLVATALFAYTSAGAIGACLGIILIPVTVFVIPYWLGERRMRAFAINIVPVFVVAVVLVSVLQTQAIFAQGEPTLSSGVPPNTATGDLPPLTLWNGTVVPYASASANQTYAFYVRLKTTTGVNASQAAAYLNISRFEGLSRTDIVYPMRPDPARANDTSNGTWYVSWRPLSPGIYGFYFTANAAGRWDSANSTFSTGVFEPIVAPWQTWYGFWLAYTAYDMIFPISFYFIILFMYWYVLRSRRMRARMIEASQKDEHGADEAFAKGEVKGTAGEKREEAPTRASEGKTKKAAAFTCTNCGADVTEDDTKCPKCGAVFED